MARNEPDTLAILKDHRVVIDQAISTRHGRIVNTAGDSVLAEFRSPIEAIECAGEIQSELAKRNSALSEHRRMDFRIGINLGDVMIDGGQIYGDGVNIAARLEGLADAGVICISGSVVDQVRGKVPYWFEDMGLQRVKNIPGRIHVYGVDLTEGSEARALARRRRRRMAVGGRRPWSLVLGWPYQPYRGCPPEPPSIRFPYHRKTSRFSVTALIALKW
jgi:class 3 adenylate cyclase